MEGTLSKSKTSQAMALSGSSGLMALPNVSMVKSTPICQILNGEKRGPSGIHKSGFPYGAIDTPPELPFEKSMHPRLFPSLRVT